MDIQRKMLSPLQPYVLVCLSLAIPAGSIPAYPYLETGQWQNLQQKLEFGSIYSALPSLLEFRKKTSSEIPRAGKGSIEFLIGLGYIEGFSKTKQKQHMRDAADAFKNYLVLSPNGKDVPITLYYRGNCLFALGDYASAAHAYSRLVKSPGNDLLPPEDKVAVIHNLAIAYYHSNQMEVGRHWFGVLLRSAKSPADKSLAASALVESYVEAGMFGKVRPLIIDIDPNSKYWSEPRLNLQLWRTAEHYSGTVDKALEKFYRNLVIYSREDMEQLAVKEEGGSFHTPLTLPLPSRFQNLGVPLPRLEKSADEHIAKGNFKAALPAIQEARSRLGNGEDGNRANFTYLSALAHLQSYQGKPDPQVLEKAINEFRRYVQEFPDGLHIHYALANLAECLGFAGDYAGSIRYMQDLLDPEEKHSGYLTPGERIRVVRYVVNASYGKEDWAVCQAWAEQLLALSTESPLKTQAAAILAEAYFANGMYTEASALLPHFNTSSRYGIAPHLNFLFMQAADTLAEEGKRELAETFYGRTMPPGEISVAITLLAEGLLPKLKLLQTQRGKDPDNFPEAKGQELQRLEEDLEALERMRKQVGRLMGSGQGNYGELLRWRRAHNLAKLGRSQEAFTMLDKLLVDYPDAEPGNRESYLYEAIVEADKLGKSESVLELAKTYLEEDKFQSHHYEISVLYTKPLLRKAQAQELHRTEQGTRAWELCEGSYIELWKLCLRLIRLHPLEPNARYVVFTAGMCWMDMTQAKFARTDELIRVFRAMANKEFDGEPPSFLDGIHYWLGMAYSTKLKHHDAFKNFAMARKLNPSGEYYRDALFRLGECAKRMGQKDKARSFFKEFMQKYPDNSLAFKAEAYLREITPGK